MRLSLLLLPLVVCTAVAQESAPRRPVHTYSIVAVDSVTGEIGVAVQSHWFSVGSMVTWAEPGVGAVATQSFIQPSYGPQGLYLMKTGVSAPNTLAALLRADPDSQVRQIGMIDAQGRVASHTGSRAIQAAGHIVGHHYAVQANLMRNDAVWPAMSSAFESATGDLAERMLAALEAAEAAGGDIRGKQSAALLVVSGDPNEPSWSRVFDLRVEDDPDPLGELRRLMRVARAYKAATDGDNFVTVGEIDHALDSYRQASEMLPDAATNGELIYWVAVTLADLGRVDEAIPLFTRSFQQDSSWRELTTRLPAAGLLRADEATIDRILREAGRR